jgi:hypothetical protein
LCRPSTSEVAAKSLALPYRRLPITCFGGNRLVQPVDKHVSPYLLQPLRSYEQVQQERERRLAEAAAQAKLKPAAPVAATQPSATNPAKSPPGFDQSV